MAMIFRNSKKRIEGAVGLAKAPDNQIAKLLDYDRRARMVRRDIFEEGVINESNWLIMQDVFAAHLDGVKLRTKELSTASGLPPTTVIRYLDHLERFGVVNREVDAEDHRVTLVSMTESGAFWMRQYYAQIIQFEHRLVDEEKGLFSILSVSQRAPRS